MVKQILQFLKNHPCATTIDVAEEMELDEDEAEEFLNKMSDKHLIDEMYDPATGYGWVALNQNDFGVIE